MKVNRREQEQRETEQKKTEQRETEQKKTEQKKMEQTKTKQRRIGQRKTESGEKRAERFIWLKVKIFLMMTGILVVSVIILYLLYEYVIFGHFAEFVVGFIQKKFSLDFLNALSIYQQTFRENWGLLIFLGMFFLFLLICWFVLMRLVIGYFKRIEKGMDVMLSGDKTEVELPQELRSLEKKMNAAKRTMERRKMEAEMENVRKNDLITYLAHDLKTPLSSVIGYLSLLEEAPDMPVKQKAKYVGIALEKAQRLEQLIDEFFEITRFNLQTIILNKRKINLSYMLEQMTDEFYPILEEQGKKAVVEAEENVFIYADADKMARVFNNILKNAIAYSDRNSTIKVCVVNSEEKTWIQFINHGDPIPEHKLNTIFEKFYRLDASRSSATGGAGLGLAIAKEIVTAHDGELLVTSSAEQTVFTVILPGW